MNFPSICGKIHCLWQWIDDTCAIPRLKKRSKMRFQRSGKETLVKMTFFGSAGHSRVHLLKYVT